MDSATQRPDGLGTFNPSFSKAAPSYDGTWVVFRDQGTAENGGGPAIWSYNVAEKRYWKLVDTATSLPDGSARFNDLQLNDSAPVVRNGMVIFAARDTAGGQGLYSVAAFGGAIRKIVDRGTPSPSGGYFRDFDGTGALMGGFAFDGNTVVFGATGTAVARGVYAVNADGSGLSLVADSAHPAAGGRVTNFYAPAVSGGRIVLIGNDGSSEAARFSGVYAANAGDNGNVSELLNSSVPLPGDNTTEKNTGYDVPVLAFDGSQAVFHASNTKSGSFVNPTPFQGLYWMDPASPAINRIVDLTSTLQGLGKLRNVARYGVSAHNGAVVFQAADVSGATGLYRYQNGIIARLIGTGDVLNGNAVVNVGEASASSLYGSGSAVSVDFGPAGQAIYLAESGAPPPPLSGALTQLASGGDWRSTITLLNMSSTQAQAHLEFKDDNGAALALPLTLPLSDPNRIVTAASHEQLLEPGAMFLLRSQSAQDSLVGWGQLTGSGGMSGFATFYQTSTRQEAAVPLQTGVAASYVLPFENLGGVVTGVALANVSNLAADVAATIRDDAGSILGVETVSLPAFGHTSFVLSDRFQATRARRGSVQFDAPAAGKLGVLGLRFSGQGAFTSVPPITASAAGSGSISQVAAGAGWQTNFTFVNTEADKAPLRVEFFDNDGKPMKLPLLFTQSGRKEDAFLVNEMLAPGAMLTFVAQDQSQGAVQVGWARVTTAARVGGSAIFRFNTSGQEATAPVESRLPASFFLAFDNSGGASTGVAVANLSNQQAAVTMKFRDTLGNVVGAAGVAIKAGGHASFTLEEMLSLAGGMRGSVELIAAEGQISTLGLRFTKSGALAAFTSIPALTKP